MAGEEIVPVAPPVVTTPTPTTTDTSSSASSSSEITADSKFETMNEFKEKAPELYSKWMETISQNIIDDMKKGTERMKKAMRKNREI